MLNQIFCVGINAEASSSTGIFELICVCLKLFDPFDTLEIIHMSIEMEEIIYILPFIMVIFFAILLNGTELLTFS